MENEMNYEDRKFQIRIEIDHHIDDNMDELKNSNDPTTVIAINVMNNRAPEEMKIDEKLGIDKAIFDEIATEEWAIYQNA